MESTDRWLSMSTLGRLAEGVEARGHARDACRIGILHIGPGAFHRAHQAVHVDDVLRLGGADWAFCGISLRSPSVRDAIAPQDCLYSLAILDRKARLRIIGSIKELLFAREQQDAVLAPLTITG